MVRCQASCSELQVALYSLPSTFSTCVEYQKLSTTSIHWDLMKFTKPASDKSWSNVPAEFKAQSGIFGAGSLEIAGGSGSSHSSYSCRPQIRVIQP